jgi:hypothetical protein
MTHIEFTDPHAKVPLSDDGIGAWSPLTDDQRNGTACIDCAKDVYGSAYGRAVGNCEAGAVYVCWSCYEQRLHDHIDYYRSP